MTISICDLHESKTLDNRALASVRGGYAFNPGYLMPKPAWFGPVSTSIKQLTNVNTQLNIAVLSQDIFQGNSNVVSQA
ncbi:hypothetical protein [Marinobacterium rhizophilum]|uniref:hypothetical protein n=1 Tax=Marinobacterium rhizophilum TaxID=420402 RepID=UPI00037BBA60|nr:hypothetical protein [Marinobacterium rhizophilum]